MLRTHMAAKESELLAQGRIPGISGHPVNKGTPRETFVKTYLQEHLSERLAIGNGEVIHAASKPEESRPQLDIVLYKREYPRLAFGGGISGFLAESVIATVEVKSTLTQRDFEQAVGAAAYLKGLSRNLVRSFHSGHIPPSILSYVVAYDGPARMSTVHGWIAPTYQNLGITTSPLPLPEGSRLQHSSAALDGVFVLGRGFMYYDNVPIGFMTGAERAANPGCSWVFADTAKDNLLVLFLLLTMATQNIEGAWLDPVPYLSAVRLPSTSFQP